MNVVDGKFGNRAPSDLSAVLRRLADDVDRGLCTSLIACYLQDDRYEFIYATSLFNSIGMASMLHANSIDRMRAR